VVRAKMLEYINIIGGLILCVGILGAVSKNIEKMVKWLGSFQTIIGIIAWILVALYFSDSTMIQVVMAFIVGLILIAGILPAIPAMGKSLEKLAKWLGSFQTLIGIIAIIVGIWGLL
jgi:hypothetical protein